MIQFDLLKSLAKSCAWLNFSVKKCKYFGIIFMKNVAILDNINLLPAATTKLE